MKATIATLVLCAVVIAIGCDVGLSEAQRANNEGNSAHKAGQFEEAISLYTKAIELDPKLLSAHSNRGLLYWQMAKYDEALTDLNQAVNLITSTTPSSEASGILGRRGGVYSDLKNYEKAIADYDRAIRLYQNNAVIYHDRGRLYALLCDYDKAIAYLGHAVKLDKKYLDAYWLRRCVCEHKELFVGHR